MTEEALDDDALWEEPHGDEPEGAEPTQGDAATASADAEPTATVDGELSELSPSAVAAPAPLTAFGKELQVLVAPDPDDPDDAPKPQVWLIELDGTPFIRLDIPHPDLEPDSVLIKDYSECEGLFPRLVALGQLPPAVGSLFVGTHECPVILLEDIAGAA